MEKGNSAIQTVMKRMSQFIHLTQNTEIFPKWLNSCHLINICRQNCSLFILSFNQFNVKYQYTCHLLKQNVIPLKAFIGNAFHLFQEENQLILPLGKFSCSLVQAFTHHENLQTRHFKILFWSSEIFHYQIIFSFYC